MVLDTSALLCVLLHEPEAGRMAASIAAGPTRAASAVTWFETLVVLTSRKPDERASAADKVRCLLA